MARSLSSIRRALQDDPDPERTGGPGAGSPDSQAIAILGLAAAGLMSSLAAGLLFGATADWQTGLGTAAVVLLLTGLGILILLHRQTRAHETSREHREARTALRAFACPAVLTDAAGSPVAANPAYAKLGGESAPLELIGDGTRLASAALEKRGPVETFADIEGRPYRVVVLARGGWLLWSLAPQTNDGEPDAPAFATQGVEDTILSALGEMLDACDLGLALADRRGTLTFINARLAGWLGVGKAEDVPHLTARTLLAPERDSFQPGGGTILEKQTVKAAGDGTTLVALRRPSSSAETQLSTGAALLEALFDAAPVGLAIVDSDGRLGEYNTAFRNFAPNQTPQAGDMLESYIASEDRTRLHDALSAVFAGKPLSKPIEVGFNTQPPRTGQVFLSRLVGREPSAVLVHLIDTTQHKSLERQFTQAQKMQAVGQLAGGVAHDFNNLLTAIIGFCDLLLVRHGPGDQSFSDIMQIKQNANRASNLVRQLLAFSRQQTMRPKILAVTDVLADLSNLLRRLIGETIELKMIHGRDLGPVRVDQGQLEQVIINLAVNARDAMPEGGTLTIRTKAVAPDDRLVQSYSVMPTADYVLIEVSDTGTGIPPEHHNKIFEPFFTTKAIGKGTGLGLSTVYGIIKQTGGFIFLESTLGEGTTFRIYLPVHERDAPTQADEASTPKDLTGRETILICEDEDAVRMFAARALENKGYTVLQTASGEEAMELLRDESREIDLLVSDVVMPNMDGPALVEAARAIRPEMRVIFISGYAEEVFRKNLGQSAGHYAFLPKPFSLKQLAETVKEVSR